MSDSEILHSSSSSSSSSESSFSSSSSSSSSIDSSSSSFSSSSSSLDSSSSSSFFPLTVELYSPMLTQDNSNLLPFGFIVEPGFSNDNMLNFSIELEGETLISSNDIFSDTTSQTYGTTYVPEKENAKERHDPFVFVDVISKDSSGIKDISVRSQKQNYGYDTPSYVFNIPRFSWTEDDLSSEESEEENGTLWMGTGDKTIHKVFYNKEYAQNVLSINTTSEVYDINFSKNNSDMYASGYDHIAKYVVNDYWDKETEIVQTIEVENINEGIISWSNSSMALSTESYSGNVVARNTNTLSPIITFSGFDAPFKTIYSQYHQCYFVAGTSILWKLYLNGDKIPVYTINGCKIADIDCSENGQVCVLLNSSSESIVRLLDNNLYSIIAESRTANETSRFCKYCGKGIFYALVEVKVGNSSAVKGYQAINCVINANRKTFFRYFSTSELSTTTTTTTIVPTIKKVDIRYPVGEETLIKGESYVVRWASTEAISDFVSISVYKGNNLVEVIATSINNTGSFNWIIPSTYENGDDYKVYITWLSASNDVISMSPSYFSISDTAETSTDTTTTKIQDSAIGIGYSGYNDLIIIVLRNGMVGLFDMGSFSFDGMFDSGVKNVLSMACRDDKTNKYRENSKVRIFVGTQPYLNDKWDSGVIETTLKSVYYGGGDNLGKGETYYVNLQVYSDRHGWSEIQTRTITMPR